MHEFLNETGFQVRDQVMLTLFNRLQPYDFTLIKNGNGNPKNVLDQALQLLEAFLESLSSRHQPEGLIGQTFQVILPPQ